MVSNYSQQIYVCQKRVIINENTLSRLKSIEDLIIKDTNKKRFIKSNDLVKIKKHQFKSSINTKQSPRKEENLLGNYRNPYLGQVRFPEACTEDIKAIIKPVNLNQVTGLDFIPLNIYYLLVYYKYEDKRILKREVNTT